MSTPSPQDVTRLLQAWSQGDESALEKLVPLVYREPHLRARRCMARERQAQSLQTTALIHEAYLRLAGRPSPVDWESRGHFFAIAATLMRRILVDRARARRSQKRGGELRPVAFDEQLAVAGPDRDLVSLDDALKALARFDERKARVVELRFFAGLTAEETASVLAVSPQTVLRDWRLAKVWLLRAMKRGEGASAQPSAEP